MATSCCRRTLPLSVDWSAGGPRPVGVPFCRRKIWPRPRFESDTGCEETSVWSTCELLKKGQSVSDMEKATFLFPHTLEDTATTTSSSAPASSARRRRAGPAGRGGSTWARRRRHARPAASARARTSHRNTASGRTPAARRAGHVRQADGAEDAAYPVGHITDDTGQPRRRCTASGCSRRGRRTNPGRAAALRRAKVASPRRRPRQPLDWSRVAQIDR